MMLNPTKCSNNMFQPVLGSVLVVLAEFKWFIGRLAFLVGLVFTLIFGQNSPSFALSITFNDIGGFNERPFALSAFEEAAVLWEAELLDPVTVHLDIGFQELGNNMVGQAFVEAISISYTAVRTALRGDITSQTDRSAVNSLEREGASFNFLVDPVPSTGEDDSFVGYRLFHGGTTPIEMARGLDGTLPIETHLAVATANAKALGLLDANVSARDTTIMFDSKTMFDFSRGDGINRTESDFVGIAAHEIGHALGFTSGVGFIDSLLCPEGDRCGELVLGELVDFAAVFTPLDLYRYSPLSVDLGRATGLPVRDLSVTALDKRSSLNFRSRFFSLNQGLDSGSRFATGVIHGDGFQPSHWQESRLGLGLMDPVLSLGELGNFSELDLLAFDAIGWDRRGGVPIPEPSTLLLIGTGLAGLAGWRWKCARMN